MMIKPAQLALAWLLAKGVTSPIASATSVEQLNECREPRSISRQRH